MMRLSLFIVFLLFLSNCGDDAEFDAEYSVDPEAESYVSDFFLEAENRGLQLETSNLIVRFENDLSTSDGDPICGNARGSLTNDNQNIIILDPECLAWRHSDLSREILIFHELAHVYLERIHENDLFQNGDYKSLMFGGNWDILRYYTEDQTKRAYYIEELFDPNTPTPDWAR